MTPEQIKEVAEKAGFKMLRGLPVVIHSNGSWVSVDNKLTEFVRLVLK